MVVKLLKQQQPRSAGVTIGSVIALLLGIGCMAAPAWADDVTETAVLLRNTTQVIDL